MQLTLEKALEVFQNLYDTSSLADQNGKFKNEILEGRPSQDIKIEKNVLTSVYSIQLHTLQPSRLQTGIMIENPSKVQFTRQS